MGQSVIVRLHISEGLLSPDKHATVHALLIHPWIKLCCTFVVVCSAYRLFQEMMPTSKGHPVAQKSESCIFLQWLRCVPAATNSVHTNIGRQELWVATYVGEIVGFGKYWPSFFFSISCEFSEMYFSITLVFLNSTINWEREREERHET